MKSHLMSDVPYGVLLSGGLDSSVISAITKKFAARRVEDQERSEAWWPQLHSFAVGLEGSPDLKAAQEVANHLGTVHHEIHFTVRGRAGCHPRRYLSHRNLRCDHYSRLDADVPDVAEN